MTAYTITATEAGTVQQDTDGTITRVDSTRMTVNYVYDCDCEEIVDYNVPHTTSEDITTFLTETAALRAANHATKHAEESEVVSTVTGLELNTSVTI